MGASTLLCAVLGLVARNADRCGGAESRDNTAGRLRAGGHRLRRADLRCAVHHLPRRQRRCRRRRQSAERHVPPRDHRSGSDAGDHGGIPGTGMQAFKFDPAEVAGVVAYLRNMNAVDRGAVKVGDAARGRTIFEGKGGCRKLPPRRRPRIARRAGPERDRGAAQRRLAAALDHRSDQPDDADQPAGPYRAARRQGRQRPATERGHLHRAADRRPGTAAVARQEPTSRIHDFHDVADAVVQRDARAPTSSVTSWPTCSHSRGDDHDATIDCRPRAAAGDCVPPTACMPR